MNNQEVYYRSSSDMFGDKEYLVYMMNDGSVSVNPLEAPNRAYKIIIDSYTGNLRQEEVTIQ